LDTLAGMAAVDMGSLSIRVERLTVCLTWPGRHTPTTFSSKVALQLLKFDVVTECVAPNLHLNGASFGP
jgi:hypothetical protein